MSNKKIFANNFVADGELDFGPHFAMQLAAAIAALMQPPKSNDITAMRLLLHDLEAIHDGRGPTDKVLSSAPLLSSWRFLVAPDGLRLTGKATDHPVLGARDRIATSPIYAVDAKSCAWARSWNKFYRLGAPCAEPPVNARSDRLH